MTAGDFASTLDGGLRGVSSPSPCSSLAGGDGGGGPTLFRAGSDCVNRAGCGGSCLGTGPDTMGVDRSDRPTL